MKKIRDVNFFFRWSWIKFIKILLQIKFFPCCSYVNNLSFFFWKLMLSYSIFGIQWKFFVQKVLNSRARIMVCRLLWDKKQQSKKFTMIAFIRDLKNKFIDSVIVLPVAYIFRMETSVQQDQKSLIVFVLSYLKQIFMSKLISTASFSHCY